jgi:exosome complex component RRP4
MNERKIVVPGETIIQGEDFLPGDGTRREEKDIVADRFGLADFSDNLVRVIPLSGVYVPRRGNVIVGTVVGINFKGWMIDFGSHMNGFLNVAEVPRYIGKGELRDFLDFGDVVCAKVFSTDGNSIDLSIKFRGYGKLNGGQLVQINPNKVPRVIGKEGSMVNLIKDATSCDISVGQNGLIWIRAEKIEDELNAKKIVEFICENSFIAGLSEKVEGFIEKEFGKKIKMRESFQQNEVRENSEEQNDKEN